MQLKIDVLENIIACVNEAITNHHSSEHSNPHETLGRIEGIIDVEHKMNMAMDLGRALDYRNKKAETGQSETRQLKN